MGPRLAILLGLLAGVVVGGALLAAYVVADPGSVTPASPAASTPAESSTPSAPASIPPSASPTGSPSVPPSASPSPSGSDPASPGVPEAELATPAATDLSAAFHIGEPAPALKLADLGGDDIDLVALKGKPVWLVFMATWCPSCQDEIPAMNSFALRYAEHGLQVIAVDVLEPRADVQAFAEQLRVQFPMGLDTDGRAAREWGVVVPPIHFWIDKDGVIREGALGGIGRDIMAEALRKVMPGVDVQP